MMASESCSTSSSSSGDDFVPIFLLRKVMKSLRRSNDNKRSTIQWMKQTQLQLKLSPVKTRATRPIGLVSACFSSGEHILVSVRRVLREGSRTALRLLFWLCRARGESSLSVERLKVDLQLSWSTCHCWRIFLQLLVLDGPERLFGHDQAPSKCLSQQQVSGNILFFATCASLPRRRWWIVHSPLFVFFLQIFAVSGSDWSRRAATQQTSSKFFVPRKSMKAHAILSMLVVLAAAESATEDRFQRRRPTRLTVSRTQSARSSSRSKAMELSTRGKADTESGRVLPKSPARKKFRESLHLHMSS